MSLVLGLLICFNLGFGVWSHKGLRHDIRETELTLISLITGKVRTDGPAAAKAQASLTQRLEVRAAERRAAPTPIRL